MWLRQIGDLNFVPGSADVFKHLIDAFLIDNSHSVRRNAQLHIAFLRLYPKTMGMQVRQKSASRLVHSMADVVPSHRAFACYLAYFGHIQSPKKFDARLYQSGPSRATKIVLGSKQTPQLKRNPCVGTYHHMIEQPYFHLFEKVKK